MVKLESLRKCASCDNKRTLKVATNLFSAYSLKYVYQKVPNLKYIYFMKIYCVSFFFLFFPFQYWWYAIGSKHWKSRKNIAPTAKYTTKLARRQYCIFWPFVLFYCYSLLLWLFILNLIWGKPFNICIGHCSYSKLCIKCAN